MSGQNKTTKHKLLGGVAAATLGALLLAPASGWLVRAQLKSAVGQSAYLNYNLPSSEQEARAQRAVRIAAEPKNQNDLGLQMAAAQMRAEFKTFTADGQRYSTGSQRADALHPLGGTWIEPNPVLAATILRDMSQEAVHIDDRYSEDFLQNRPPHVVVAAPDKNANSPNNLASWQTYCMFGEVVDSDNAYFPLMRAVGLVAAHQNDAGIDALIEASEKPRFDEYMADEVEGQWRLNRKLQGRNGVLGDLAVSAAQLYPQYAQFRELSTFAAAEAVRAEMAGDTEKGFRIRHALTRIGALMRTNGKPIISGLMGRAVSKQAWTRPGGAPPLPPSPPNADDAAKKERSAKLRARYCAYLEHIGHPEAAREVVWEAEAAETTMNLWDTERENPDNLLNLQPIERLMTQWAVGVGLLTNLLVLLLLGGLCALAARWNVRIRSGFPLPPAARTGAVVALALPVIGLGVALFWPEPVSLLLILGGAGALSAMIIGGIRRARLSPPSLSEKEATETKLPNVRAFLGGMAFTVLTAGVLFALAHVGPLQALRESSGFLGLRSSSENPVLAQLMGAGASSCVSLLLVFGLAIYSRARRIPVTVGIVRGLRRVALPAATVLALLYAGLTVDTLRKEATATADLQTCVRAGEAAYFAGLLHEPLPGRYVGKTGVAAHQFITADNYNDPFSGIPSKTKAVK